MAKKHKNKAHETAAQSATALYNNGLKSFQREEYAQAISTWERIPAALRPVAALAEAYFRRGTQRFYQASAEVEAGLKDLQRATEYQPDDPVYAYHLGLAAHRMRALDQAIPAYRLARRGKGKIATRAAYPLALALLQQGQDPAAEPALWNDLSAEEQMMLQSVTAFRRRPYHLPATAPRLWRALAAFDGGDRAAAQAGLSEVLAGAKTPFEQGLAHYYRGALAAQAEDWETARREWGAAYAAGLRTPRLNHNLGEIFHRLAEECLTAGDVSTALAAGTEALRHKPDERALNELLSQVHQHLGYQAASANRWDAAQKHWQTAVDLDSSSFRLAYNLALAYERDEDYLSAGHTWREALARRPRRADHPDALTGEQVARLWRRAAQDYEKAGEAYQAVQVYQQAIKKDPENIDLRMAMVDGMLAEGRPQAAQNALGQILQRNPDYIPALLRMGEVLFNSEHSWYKIQAVGHWTHILELQPDHLQARQALSDYYCDQGEIAYSWDRFTQAVQYYQKALEYLPGDAIALAEIANCYIHLEDEKQTHAYIDQALAREPASLDVVDRILSGLFEKNLGKRAWQWMEQAEARIASIPGEFYAHQGVKCFELKRKALAPPWLERAVVKAAPSENICLLLGRMLVDHDDDLARQYLERALAAGQKPGEAHLILGVLEAKADNRSASQKHFQDAERIARQIHDENLAKAIEMAKTMFAGPMSLMRRMMQLGDFEDFDDLDDDEMEDFLDGMEDIFEDE